MSHPEDLALMARTIKLLADRGRLAILGLLADRPRTLNDLFRDLTSFSPAEIERRLRMLEDAEWIASDEGEYSLRRESLTFLRAALARIEAPRPPDATNAILGAFFDKDGRLRGLPAQRPRREMILRHAAERCFTAGRSYNEREVNDLLAPIHEDSSMLCRAMTAAGILDCRDGAYTLSQPRSPDPSRSADVDSGVPTPLQGLPSGG